MVGNYQKFPIFLLLFVMTSLLASCSTSAATPAYPAGSTVSQEVLQQFEHLLNAGNLSDAAELFDYYAILIELNPSYHAYDDSGTYLSRQLSFGNEVTYKGKDDIKAYLFSLTHNQFQSNNSSFREDDNSVVWECYVTLADATLEMEFKAVMGIRKIEQLTVTNSQLVNRI